MAGRFAAVLLEPGWEPVDEQVEGLLGPFTALLRVKPYKCYLRPDEIEDVADEYDLPADNLQALADRSKLKKSTGYGTLDVVDEGGLYCMETGNPQGYWDWWRIVAGVELLFHGAPVISARDALDRLNWMSREDFEELEIDTVVTPGGQWHDCNGIQHFDGRQFVEQQVVPTEEWYGKVVGLLQSHQDCMVVAVGYHS